MTKFLLAAGIALAYVASSAAAQTVRLKSRCEGSRCVYYDRTGNRRFSAERDDTGRTVIKSRDGSVRAKVTEDGRGSARIERFGRRW